MFFISSCLCGGELNQHPYERAIALTQRVLPKTVEPLGWIAYLIAPFTSGTQAGPGYR
jgi:hypothetical protein